MTPYYQDAAGITIYNARCEDVLPLLSCVHLCVTSPPYNKVGHEGFVRTPSKHDNWAAARNIVYDDDDDDNLPEDDYQARQIAMLHLLGDALVDGGSVFYSHKVRVHDFRCTFPTEWLLRGPLSIRQEIVWDRNSTLNVAPNRFQATTERIYWLFKGTRPRYFNPAAFRFKEVWSLPPEIESAHPAPFPISIPQRCITACARDGDTILDPYMGSGTTLLAAKKCGHKAIGIELSRRYCDLAIARLQQSVLPLEVLYEG